MTTSSLISELIGALARRRRFIFLTTFLVGALSIGIILLFPRSYASTTTILPPRSTNLLGGLGDVSSLVKQFSPLKGIAGVGGGMGDLYTYVTILQSRPALERVIESFDLMRVYEIDDRSMEKARKALKGNMDLLVNDEGTLTIRVFDRDPARAARMADSMVAILDELNIAFNTRQARANRRFIEERLGRNRSDIARMEDSLRRFQEANGVVIIPQEAASSMSGFAQIYGMKAMKELQIGLMKQTMAADNILLQTAQQELAEINRQLGSVPEMGTAYFRLYRDYMVQQKIFEVLTPLYEQARIEENRDTPTLMVLERANVPERPERPKRVIIVTIITVLGFLAAWGTAWWRERLARMKELQPDAWAHLHDIWENLRALVAFSARR